jgi:hypothetical protein
MEVKLIHGDCITEMNNISDKSIDMILCDLPYGTTKCSWDIIIPFDKLWEQYNRIIKDNGVIVLFGQEPFSSLLRCSNISDYKYDIYWEKERITNIMQVKKRVGKNIETISVFYKKQCTYNPQMIKYEGPKRSNKVKNGKLGKLVDDNNNKFVKELLKVYSEYTGNKNPNCYINAGGTYRQYLKNALETGTTLCWNKDFDLPKGHGAVHQPDECINIDGFLNAIELTALMLIKADEIL